MEASDTDTKQGVPRNRQTKQQDSFDSSCCTAERCVSLPRINNTTERGPPARFPADVMTKQPTQDAYHFSQKLNLGPHLQLAEPGDANDDSTDPGGAPPRAIAIVTGDTGSVPPTYCSACWADAEAVAARPPAAGPPPPPP